MSYFVTLDTVKLKLRILDVVLASWNAVADLKDIRHVGNWSTQIAVSSGIPLFCDFLLLFHEFSVQ